MSEKFFRKCFKSTCVCEGFVAFFFLPCSTGCSLLVPDQGWNPWPLQWKHGVLTLDYQGSPCEVLIIYLNIIFPNNYGIIKLDNTYKIFSTAISQMLALTQQNILEEENLKHGVGKRWWFKLLILNIKLHHLTGSYTNKSFYIVTKYTIISHY